MVQENASTRLKLLGDWELHIGEVPVRVTCRHQRLITAIALNEGKSRRGIAEMLWPNGTDGHAAANLRVGIWDIKQRWPQILTSHHQILALSPQIETDISEISKVIKNIEYSRNIQVLHRFLHIVEGAELLPEWCEPWLIRDQERLHQLRLEALETLAENFLELGDSAAAIKSAQAAVEADPLRESSYSLLIQAHAVAGNHALALKAYDRIRTTLAQELNILPGPELRRLETAIRVKGTRPISLP